MRSSAFLASSPLSIVTARPAQARVVLRHRREHMRADRPVGIADRDRDLDARIEHLAPVRHGLVACRAARKAFCVARLMKTETGSSASFASSRRLGGGGLLALGRLGGVLCCGGRIELRLRVGPGGVELRLQLLRPWRRPSASAFLGSRSGLVRLCAGECLCSANASSASARAL